jgi:RNA polymerase sigma factor (sigma-70 family)
MDKKLIKISQEEIREMTFEEVKEKYNGLLHKKASEYLGRMEYEEAYQLALIGLWNAYKKHDARKGFLFLTLAYTYTGYAISNELRKDEKHLHNKKSQVKGFVSLQEGVYEGKDGKELKLEDILKSDEDCIEDFVENDFVNRILSRISPRHKEDIEAYINGEASIRTLCDKYNISRFIAERRINVALGVLRKEYTKQIS